jgi:hypothetical protein
MIEIARRLSVVTLDVSTSTIERALLMLVCGADLPIG